LFLDRAFFTFIVYQLKPLFKSILMKNALLTFLLLVFCLTGFAQVDIKNKIVAFNDSTEMLIRNGRNLIVERTIKGDSETAIKTIDYLKKNIDKSYVVFFPEEEIILSIANSNFQQFLYTAKNFDSLLEGKTKQIGIDNIIGPVYEFISNEISLIKKDIEGADLKEEEKQLLRIYLKYYEGEDNLELNKEIKRYKKVYPKTDYSNFIEQLSFSTRTSDLNLCLGYGHEFLNGNISKVFDDHFSAMNFEVECFVNQMYYSLFMSGSVSSIHSNRDIQIEKYDYIHTSEDDAFSIKFGGKVGRSWYRNQTFNVFSYVSLGGYQVKSQKSNFDIADSESANLKLTNSFFAGVGTACDITIKSFKNKITEEKVGAWFIRPNIGYDLFLTNNENSKGGSLYINLTMGIGLGG
jgi:hypothetical protein